jgi:hypothetical protein
MSVIQIVCDNCGAKYKLPESFSAPKAKCKKCGSAIDVNGQRSAARGESAAAATPAKAQPAKARPAKTRATTNRAGTTAEEGKPARGSRGASPRRAGRDAQDKPASGRRGRGEGNDGGQKKNNTPMLLACAAGVVVIGIGAFFLLGGEDKPAATSTETAQTEPKGPDTQQTQPAAATQPEASTSEAAAALDSQPEPAKADVDTTPNEAAAKTDEPAANNAADAEPTGNATEASASTPAAEEGVADGPNTGTERWMRNKTKSMDQVFDVKSLGDVQWPADCPTAMREEVEGLIEDIANGGRAGIKAKPQLEEPERRYYALYGLIDRLWKLDYTQDYDNRQAWEINKVLDSILAGLNTGAVPVEAGESLDPRKADHNAKAAKAWQALLRAEYTKDQDAFEAWRKKRTADKR